MARADGQVTQPIGTAPDGTRIFLRRVGFGFFLIAEAKAGQSNRLPGTQTFNPVPGELPNLHMVVSRPLGNGSALVCDNGPDPPIGGVPAVDPPMFGGSLAAANAINDLGCRFEARTNTADACTRNGLQDAAFVNAQTRVQFCPVVGVGHEIAFPLGDTRVTVRVTDILGNPGLPASIIIRVQP